MREPVKPEWLKVRASGSNSFKKIRQISSSHQLHTVCDAAQCPNISECWSKGHATFMILGNVCTRNCLFCAVKSASHGELVREDEARAVSRAIKEMGLKHAVITSVTRDDLADRGAGQFKMTIEEIKKTSPATTIEILAPDFGGRKDLVEIILSAHPNVFAHNLETVRRLQNKVRDHRCDYDKSLEVLRAAKEIDPSVITKTSLMLGLGERSFDLFETLGELRDAEVDILTLGQYLKPKGVMLPVARYLHPDEFRDLEDIALRLGFKAVASGPLVRSSYMAGETYQRAQGKVV